MEEKRMSLIVPEDSLEMLKKDNKEKYEQAVKFNAAMRPFYDEFDDEQIMKAWIASEPVDVEDISKVTLADRMKLFETELRK